MRRLATLSAIALIAVVAFGSSASATFPGTNGDIAFTRSIKDQTEIFVVDPDTGDSVRLTRTPRARETMPDWNDDGTRIVYSRCGRGEFSNCDLWMMDADGSNQTRITTTPDAQETWPTWSPDGVHIAYTSNAEDPFQDIWVIHDDGTDATRLTTFNGFDAFPEWS
ncbi:MAG TPA: hypothetical protein VEC09_02275, partial [Actinomycetota bacterium]|nr:hypothetical protein [Actinomycetota bacterium]